MSEKRTCPVPDCETEIRPGFLMCKPHWKMVPRREQRAVHRTWRAFINTPASEVPKRNEFAAYRNAVDAAMKAIETEIARSMP